MAGRLDVYLHSDLVGHLAQHPGGGVQFDYAESWLNTPGAVPLSQSLPLRAKRFQRKECQGFFAGILPDEAKREIIARNLGISARNDYAMLERIGGECAGAVTFLPAGEPLPVRNDNYRPLSAEQLAAILRELPRRPLLAGDEGIRLSLAGAQDKIAARIENGEVCLPLGGAPSTHILKPAVDRFADVVFNEALCMKLAAGAGLPAAAVATRSVQGIDYLLVERYDRVHKQHPGTGPVLERLHQEDFCQALGLLPEHKYQKEGGPSLKQCFRLLREVSSAPAIDLARLLEAVIFNYLVGNNDAHGKNFSLLYHGAGTADRATRLAPLYDVVCTVYYSELSPNMAMRIGDEYLSEKVTARSFEHLAEEAGLGKPLVRARVPEMAARVLAALEKVEIANPAAEKVAALIRQRAVKVRDRFRG
ncbi:type II toxin-antitoxin system HipA family toxin [uncultured Paludibaculum sp.]|uniref:type II toxin-antitoxin system HipA family toxin n=1 Tax=uncultured Paludibaculum sp. TaxID=1765020 RepID=UPI002AAB20DF|nr:type II toxin-antitoxin system HipA family toxin [uncultured Paludibaculum sp.]